MILFVIARPAFIEPYHSVKSVVFKLSGSKSIGATQLALVSASPKVFCTWSLSLAEISTPVSSISVSLASTD